MRQKLLNTSGWISDACLIGFSHKTVVPDELLAANANAGSYPIEKYQNSNIKNLVEILHFLKTTTTWHFHYLYILLRENHKINAIFSPSFHDNGCNPACKIWHRLRTGESAKFLTWMTLSHFPRRNRVSQIPAIFLKNKTRQSKTKTRFSYDGYIIFVFS